MRFFLLLLAIGCGLGSSIAGASDIFKENIDKKMANGQSVARVLHKRFEIELVREAADYQLLSWLLSRMKLDSAEIAHSLYRSSVEKYLNVCKKEKDFGLCMSLALQDLSVVFSTDSIYSKLQSEFNDLSSGEIGALAGLYFYFPVLSDDKIFNQLRHLYQKEHSVFTKRKYLRVFFEPQLLGDSNFVGGLQNGLVKSVYLLTKADKGEIDKQCRAKTMSYNEKNFPLFSLCVVNLAKQNKKEAIAFLNSNKKHGMRNPWFQLMCGALDPACLSAKEKVKINRFPQKKSAFAYYLDVNQAKIQELEKEVQVGMAYLFKELGKLK